MANTKATKEQGIQFIERIKGSYYRVQIRLKGCPHLSKNHDSFEEAKLRNHRTIIGHLHWWKNEISYCILSQFREGIIAKCRDKLKKNRIVWVGLAPQQQ